VNIELCRMEMVPNVIKILLVLNKINEQVFSTSGRWENSEAEGSQGAFHRLGMLVIFLL